MSQSTAALVQLFGVQQSHDSRLRDLQQGLADAAMVNKLAAVTRAFQLSKPLVAAFEAVPGFNQALKDFPKQELLNLVAEHPSSPSSVAALESFSEAETEQVSTLATRANGLTEGFDQLLGSIDVTASSLREQIDNAEEKLNLVDDLDELVASTPVTTLSDSAYSTLLTAVNDSLGQITHFNTEELRAHPDKIAEEVNAFSEMATTLGPILGFSLAQYGLVDSERAPDYQPMTSSFAAAGLTKASLQYHLAKGLEILNQFELLAQQRDYLVDALRTEAQAMPDAAASDDVTYGYEAHSVLLGCYTGFVTKLVMGGVYAISMLLAVADTVMTEVGH